MDGPPKKYVKINGVMKMNPAYIQWKNSVGGMGAATPGLVPVAAMVVPANMNSLPVVCSMDDHMKLNEDIGDNIPLAASTDATIEMMQEPEISLEAGMAPDEMVDELGAILGKYEVPMGLMNKLMMLSEYASLEFIIDDSGSMQMNSDTINPLTRKTNTRWEESHMRLKEMVEILAYVPFQQIGIEFLNRKDRLTLKRNGMNPANFLKGAIEQIDTQFARGPSGTTPALEKLQESFLRGQGVSIARYFFGDGLPNGGRRAITEIVRIVKNRQEPQMNPVTFISCTNEDEAVEWMKDCEEVAPFCSESDDYGDESREVRLDQGEALPYTRGFWLICQLVAAMNPDDLDAMDESVPFTKNTLDNLLGIRHNEESYRYYFDAFVKNQRNRKANTAGDRLKKQTRWNYNEFLHAPVAKDIPAVQHYNRQIVQIQGF
mmetsp:Transcript_23161/g.54762  ORF Transcript_23161/g.54762 Transcript_23161/m.54762 type:complete len:432 (+) Transcript_23161:161-1456(+)|eukprot:CAMPEP_0197183856 /NCGR_PEP_ID=MMETSP1423-20130617/8571_1 /TAXON_ID=476441 /ORGANISM="Pseudo-nitzschia heimii, Strain UNC1101" /LENGTH=431 /DNA_ID=CAMNT_0042634501 /DNA_START=137 /DNA_END=1432 /DNA_ORIENTATION=+